MVRHFLSPVVTKAVAGFVVGCALVLPARAHAQTHGAAARCRIRWRRARAGFRRRWPDRGQQRLPARSGGAHFDKANHAGWTRRSRRRRITSSCRPSRWASSVASLIGANSHKGFLVGGRAGYNFNFTDNLGIWPSPASPTTTRAAGAAGLQRPRPQPLRSRSSITRAARLRRHRPVLQPEVAGDGENSYGVTSTVGGWF